MQRCAWVSHDPIYQQYHDEVWGRPVTDPAELFAKLCLDGQQAGLSWITILRKQANYYQAFANFDATQIARFDEKEINCLLHNPGIIRNRAKIDAVIANARAYLYHFAQKEDFARYLWSFVDYQVQIGDYIKHSDVPTANEQSTAMAKSLKKLGFKFVGPTICYAFMEAVGMLMNHTTDCAMHHSCRTLAPMTETVLKTWQQQQIAQ